MAQLSYRANLSARSFPMLAANWGRTIIIPQSDQTYNREMASQEDMDRDIGVPQVYYCHNVLPTGQGFQSIGYEEVYAAYAGTFADPLQEVYALPTVDSERIFLGSTATQIFYRRAADWVFSANLAAPITVAAVSGTTYIANPGSPIKYYAPYFSSPQIAYTSGLNEALTLGIVGSSGYLIVWTRALTEHVETVGTITLGSPTVTGCGSVVDLYEGQEITSAGFPPGTTILSIAGSDVTMTANATGVPLTIKFVREAIPSHVLWSSTIDPKDFVPSLSTGAGGGAIEVAKGEITHCIAHSLGFFVFTTRNVVAALYTNNSRYPFQFREIVNSGGITGAERVAADTNSGNIYAYTSSGLQMINSTQAQTIFPEVTDFLGGSLLEDYDESTQAFTLTQLADLMQVRLTIVADRYLVISYGVSAYTHALVYDIPLQRWGKLKFTHIKCMDDIPSTSSIAASFSKKSILFFTAEGRAVRWVFDTTSSSSIGVILLGKYQYVRSRLLQLDEVNVEQVEATNTLQLVDLPTLDGRNATPVTGYLMDNVGGFRKYLFNSVGVNHSLLLRGMFNLVSLVLTFSIHGKR